jgi:hypothetical protein
MVESASPVIAATAALPPRGTDLARCKQPLATLVKLGANKFPAQPDPFPIDHPARILPPRAAGNPAFPESHQRRRKGLSRFNYSDACPKSSSLCQVGAVWLQ